MEHINHVPLEHEPPPGTQIAVKGLLENLDASLTFLYPLVSADGYYFHHGMYLGNGQVSHFAEENKSNKANAKPRICSAHEFLSRGVDGKIYEVNYGNSAPVSNSNDTISTRLNTLMNHPRPEMCPKYHIISCNCETFACWLRTGREFSVQATNAVHRIKTIVCLALICCLIVVNT